MIKMTKQAENWYEVVCDGASLSGDEVSAKLALRTLGVKVSDRKMAFEEMRNTGHKSAEFGVFCHFICTSAQ